ncbi:MAG: NAD(P)-dependent oxidoreductase [Candidatus Berkelbacteria bacterium]
MKIAFFDIKPEDEKYFKDNLPEDELYFSTGIFTPEDVEKVRDYEIISIRERSKLTADMLKKMPNLRVICARTTGFNHIDTECYSSGDTILCNVPAYGQTTVAEHAFALILTLSRKIYKSKVEKVGHFFNEPEIQGFDLQGKTIGIIGTGKIGSNVARIARGFDMNILGYDFYQNAEVAEKYGLVYVPLDELLEKSDVITLHLPSTPETHYLINKTNISKIKKGAILVNTARGDLIEAEALLEALNSGIIASAGLDVLQGEERIFRQLQPRKADNVDLANEKLLDHDNVIVTPHNAFNTVEAYQRILNCTIENIHAYKNNQPKNVIK